MLYSTGHISFKVFILYIFLKGLAKFAFSLIIACDRILIAINQADVAMKGRGWNFNTNTPDEKLIEFLEQQSNSIQKRIKEATGVTVKKPIYYSAEYGYNVTKFYDFIIDNMPRQRRDILL